MASDDSWTLPPIDMDLAGCRGEDLRDFDEARRVLRCADEIHHGIEPGAEQCCLNLVLGHIAAVAEQCPADSSDFERTKAWRPLRRNELSGHHTHRKGDLDRAVLCDGCDDRR